MNEPIVSICIPSYNRPVELKRLLESIDAKSNNIEIVIREDCSPKRDEVRKVVEKYAKSSKYNIKYIENEVNFGYDKNIRQSAKVASGKWVIFMGDDDTFVSGALDQYMDFLMENPDLGYVLRRYRNVMNDGIKEDYRYAKKNVFFVAGEKTIIELFRRSLFISGFTFQKKCFEGYEEDQFDGTLLFQLYILSCVCLKNKAAYCDILITQSMEGGTPFFGVSESEKDLYESGKNDIKSSLNFMAQVPFMTKSIDGKLGTNITDPIMISYSKYSYGFLHEHRQDGIKVFNEYTRELIDLGYARTYHFYIYYVGLLILGKKNCQGIIRAIKQVRGSTPHL